MYACIYQESRQSMENKRLKKTILIRFKLCKLLECIESINQSINRSRHPLLEKSLLLSLSGLSCPRFYIIRVLVYLFSFFPALKDPDAISKGKGRLHHSVAQSDPTTAEQTLLESHWLQGCCRRRSCSVELFDHRTRWSIPVCTARFGKEKGRERRVEKSI